VVFRPSATRTPARETLPPQNLPLSGPWALAFPSGWGANEPLRLERLTSWTDLDLPAEARAFSGTASYTTDFVLTNFAGGAKVGLDLGRVEVIASVRINGQLAGTVWLPPYRLDITRLVKPGLNHLSVEVTSTWFNRLVYDAGLDEKSRKTWTINGPRKDSALVPTGLLGPVTLQLGQAPNPTTTQ
jgi:hypothetical protein